MRLRRLLGGVLLATALLACQPVLAAQTAPVTYTTQDGVLSIQVPSMKWQLISDPNYYLALTDGKNVITISHLSNGEKLPKVEIANGNYAGMAQNYISTTNEVFVVKGAAAKRKGLKKVLDIMDSVEILKYDTKKAVKASDEGQFTYRAVGETYYSISDHLNVRAGCNPNAQILGFFGYGAPVNVKAVVLKDGMEYGWCQVEFNNLEAYVSSEFLSKNSPAAQSAATPAPTAAPTPTAAPNSTEAPEQEAHIVENADPFTVYSEAGGYRTISLLDNGQYQDNRGYTYDILSGDRYYCHETGIVYAADKEYWTNGAPTPDDEEEDDNYDYDEDEDNYNDEEDDEDYDYDNEDEDDYDYDE